jgi:hypothetical protein
MAACDELLSADTQRPSLDSYTDEPTNSTVVNVRTEIEPQQDQKGSWPPDRAR